MNRAASVTLVGLLACCVLLSSCATSTAPAVATEASGRVCGGSLPADLMPVANAPQVLRAGLLGLPFQLGNQLIATEVG